MIVKLNSYAINDASNSVYLDEPINGLELPPLRTSSGDYAGRDGGFVGAQHYSARPISLTGHVFSTDVAVHEQRRREFQAAIQSGTITMQLTTNAGLSYLLYCNLIDFKMPIQRNKFESPFKIELLAGDPIIYDDTGGGALSASVPKLAAGGYTYPVVYPVVYAPGSSPTTVNNTGTEPVYPAITLSGTMTNPVLTNVTTGEVFGLNPLVTGPGDQVVIDMLKRTVTLNGGNIFGLIAANSSFWPLEPGNNSISLTTSSGADSVSALLSWRNGYLAI